MIMRPVIGFSMSFDDTGRALMTRRNYVAMIRAAGGEPVLLPTGDEDAAARLIGMCDGLLLTGGDDVNPERYGEQALECCGNITPERDLFERALVMAALERDLPVFGICRGIQSLNVILGGSLYQDLATQVSPECTLHRQSAPFDVPAHEVNIVEGSPLHALLGTARISVNSMHHQAIKRLAPELEAMAYAPQGFVEAVRMPGRRYVRAVQWHPEYMCEMQADAARRAQQLAIVGEFISAAARP